MEQLNWTATEERAEQMTDAGLIWSHADAIKAGDASWAMERAGLPVTKTQGYYYDEASCYAREIARRRAA